MASTVDLSERKLDFILPKLPFSLDFPTGLRPGAIITINAVPLNGCHSFTIYVNCKHDKQEEVRDCDEIGFLLRILMKERKSTVFTRDGKKIKLHDRDTFRPSKRFEMMLVIKPEKIICVVNGKIIAEFGHVVPYTDLTELNITDDLIVEKIIYEPGKSDLDRHEADLSECLESTRNEIKELKTFVNQSLTDAEKSIKASFDALRHRVTIKINALEKNVERLSKEFDI